MYRLKKGDQNPRKMKGYAYVEFDSVQTLEAALDAFNKTFGAHGDAQGPARSESKGLIAMKKTTWLEKKQEAKNIQNELKILKMSESTKGMDDGESSSAMVVDSTGPDSFVKLIFKT